jgi:hypothetical protein
MLRLGLISGMIAMLVACGGSAGATPTTPDDGGAAPTQDDGGGGEDPAAGTSVDPGAYGGDVGDRSKGSVQAQITGGYTGSVDLPFAAPLAQFDLDDSDGAYLPFTDPSSTLFMTITGGKDILLQYVHPDAALTSGATPCTLDVETLDDGQAKGSFTCKGMTLIQGETVGSADINGSFEAHR